MADVPGVLEIRVHGVHGTSPQNMLGTAEIGQVAGDRMTGFYRSRSGKLPNRTLPSNVAVEAYSWGSLTSTAGGFFGWVRRAGWLFLLPFAMVNLAYWARPTLNTGTRQARVSAGVVRTAALLLTLLLVLMLCLVGIDLIAWQCYRGGVQACPALPSVLDFLARPPMQTLPRRLAVGSAVPLLGVALLWLLSQRSAARCEEVVAKMTTEALQAHDQLPGRTAILARREMWAGQATVVRLRKLHVAFAILAIVGYSGAAVVNAGWSSEKDRFGWPAGFLLLELAACALVALVVLREASSLGPGDVESDLPVNGSYAGVGAPSRAVKLLRVSAAILVLHLLLLGIPEYAALDQSGDLFLHNVWFIATFVVLAALGTIAFLVERAKRVAMIVGVALMAVLVVGSPLLAITGPRLVEGGLELWHAALIWVMVTAIFAVMARWHYTKQRRRHKEEAWGGAGCSVMLNASAWVALLFTTAIITLTADWLNGDEHTVTGLQTQYAAEQVGSDLSPRDVMPALKGTDDVPAGGPGSRRNVYLVGGDVTVVGGIVEVSRNKVTIRSGRVVADSLARLLPEAINGKERISTRFGSVEMHNAVLGLPEGAALSLQDSCLERKGGTALPKRGGAKCTVERVGFVASAVVDVAGATTEVLTDGLPDVQVSVRKPPQAPIVLPQVLIWAPIGQLLWFLALLAVGTWCWLRLRGRVRDSVKALVNQDADSDPDPEKGIANRDRGACTSARLRAGYPHRAEALLDYVGLVTVPFVLGIIVFSSTGQPPWQLADAMRPVAGIAMWAVLGMSLLLVLILSRMRTSVGSRKAVGILWDLTTFWPRAAHPLAPPCYAERVVPELLIRVRWALRSAGSHVILSGHSQGSAILMAVTQRLAPADVQRVRIITYGSQIRAWYGRIFPAVLGPDILGNTPTDGAPNFSRPEPDALQVTAATQEGPAGSPDPAPPQPAPSAPVRPTRWNTVDGQEAAAAHAAAQAAAVAADQAATEAVANLAELADPADPAAANPEVRAAAQRAKAPTEAAISAQERAVEAGAQVRNADSAPVQPAAVPWWVNLFRRSDPIGFRVFSDQDSAWDLYVQEVPDRGSGDPTPVVEGHSNYQHTAAYAACVARWFDEVPEPGPPPDGAQIRRPAFLDVPFLPEA